MNYTEQEFAEMAAYRFKGCATIDEAKKRMFDAWIIGPSIRYYKVNEVKLTAIKAEIASEIESLFANYAHVLPEHIRGGAQDA